MRFQSLIPLFLLLLCWSCGPATEGDHKIISSAEIPRQPRHGYPVIFHGSKLQLHLQDEFRNDTLCNFFAIRTGRRKADSLIFKSRLYPNRPMAKKSNLFLTDENHIWWYTNVHGTYYWKEENGKWKEYRYEEPWDSVLPAPDYLKEYAPDAHPH